MTDDGDLMKDGGDLTTEDGSFELKPARLKPPCLHRAHTDPRARVTAMLDDDKQRNDNNSNGKIRNDHNNFECTAPGRLSADPNPMTTVIPMRCSAPSSGAMLYTRIILQTAAAEAVDGALPRAAKPPRHRRNRHRRNRD